MQLLTLIRVNVWKRVTFLKTTTKKKELNFCLWVLKWFDVFYSCCHFTNCHFVAWGWNLSHRRFTTVCVQLTSSSSSSSFFIQTAAIDKGLSWTGASTAFCWPPEAAAAVSKCHSSLSITVVYSSCCVLTRRWPPRRSVLFIALARVTQVALLKTTAVKNKNKKWP